jgi:16S rRNA A1518/A1519 N6-dimethyltransferase RsmA/KsgA/DIM1 with predicted DNA glycosylase/AP lyase activity
MQVSENLPYRISAKLVEKFVGIKLNSVVLVRKRTIPTERTQPAGEVSANFSW